ncbi:purine-nucleoside phosphorylase [Candidatus Falkowbacteria bacterium RIFOXYB2_FULL_34_18]|uniref:Purine-nucleoside phosphorylase n=1 Tax=Candidatus Falkowbacteria bacterium RIFOXYD2_FULL_34_120 TaxID=1798007 RepID=A0A1F5TM96_9BACT|nr:MAG: purine-nucleoside phosphorylase [Candidatus Falkowbacteria bacterium RIFOXYB2_FULL_34_18]OGF29230.1 MAG: purine-nucleoside phosphorylase [Candidatus Falkowbacteria bacterium RIFOXYC12_FULL_34_55]OGF37768.1 MAG: purine-nucleoside phosphorylase [Candidatus Falkowbacteria bacterium RIFOXYC2_FULL_34_220]OGF38752.1 MAG: purine-nucleoside phosphorylase [Candidatus Falkowbacteria bacterium RIFOXYD12_FULL_34_57]OGF39986.1 MAG: purine-nucleoside phosphorylase [Candidatus Falkowbacteria bacterium
MKLCSACLLGIDCRYNQKGKPNDKIIQMAKDELLIPVCPEQLGGLATPRAVAEIKDGRVINQDGKDVTAEFRQGAGEVLKIAKFYDIRGAILKQKSPSCGCGKIYDGTFSGVVIEGDGLTTKLLKENGIKVETEDDL